MNESAHQTARDLIRLCDYDGASRIVDEELQRCEDQGNSADIWSLRCSKADLIRLHGQTEEALAYLSAKEDAFPPASNDVPSLIRLKNTRGYCNGMLGKYATSDGLFDEAELLAKILDHWSCYARYGSAKPGSFTCVTILSPQTVFFERFSVLLNRLTDGTSVPSDYGALARIS